MYIGRTPFDKSLQKSHRKMQYLEEFKAVWLYKMSLQYNTVFIVVQPLSQGSYQQSCRQSVDPPLVSLVKCANILINTSGGLFMQSPLWVDSSVRLTLKWTTNSHSNLYEVFSIVYMCVCVFVWVSTPLPCCKYSSIRHISLMKSNKSAPNDLLPEVVSELCEIR